jgi:hypothetical protein
MVANALREASNLERFDEQTYTMMVNIGKNVVYHMHKFVGGLDMNDFGTENSPGDLDLMKAKVTDERKGLFWAVYKEAIEFGVNYARNTSCTQIGRALQSNCEEERACLDSLVIDALLTLVFLDVHSCRVGYTEKTIAKKGEDVPSHMAEPLFEELMAGRVQPSHARDN